MATTTIPIPTTDLEQVRRDLAEHGYGLLRDALAAESIAVLTDRLLEQAECEGRAGIAYVGDGSGMVRDPIAHTDRDTPHQIVRMLLNKGAIFHDVARHPGILDLMGTLLGNGFLLSSSVGIVMRRGSKEQALHTDQVYVPFPTPVPVVANVIFMITPFDPARGSTRVVPGSHKLPSPTYNPMFDEAGKLVSVGEPQCDWLAVEGPAGTALVFDGRLWHGGGSNVSGELRLAISNYYGAIYMRQNDLLPLGLNDDVVVTMPDEMKLLCGFDTMIPGGGGLGRIDPGVGRTNVSISWPNIGEQHR